MTALGGSPPGRSKLYSFNLVWALLLQVVNVVMTLVVPRITIQFYGSAENGLVASITQVVTMFLVVEAGLSNAAMLALFKPLANNQSDRVRALVAAVERMYRPIGFAFLALTIALAIVYPLLIPVPTMARLEVGILVMVLGVNGAVDFLFYAKYRVLLQAAQRAYVVSRASVLYLLLSTLAVGFVAVAGGSLVDGRSVAAAAVLAKVVLLRLGARQLVDFSAPVATGVPPEIPNRGDVVLQQILGSVQVGAPAILATVFTDLNSVSVLSVYLLVSVGLTNLLSVVVSAAIAGFGDLYARGLLPALRRAYFDLELVHSLASGIAYGVALALVLPFMRLYVAGLDGVDYVQPTLGWMTCLNGWLYVVKAPMGAMVISAGHFRQTRFRVVAQALIILGCGFALAPWFGLVGILAASIGSNLYRVVDLMVYVPRKILDAKSGASIRRVAVSGTIMLTLGVFGGRVISQVDSWIDFVVVAAIGCMAGGLFAIVLCVLVDRPALMSLARRCRGGRG